MGRFYEINDRVLGACDLAGVDVVMISRGVGEGVVCGDEDGWNLC